MRRALRCAARGTRHFNRAHSSVEEQTAHNRLIAGSKPAGPTFDHFINVQLTFGEAMEDWALVLGIGIIVGIIVGIILLIMEYRTKWFANSSAPRKTPDTLSSPTNEQESKPSLKEILPEGNQTKPSPREIIHGLDGLPPYQALQVRDSYKGIKVIWKLTFYTLNLREEGTTFLMLRDQGKDPWVYCVVNLEEYPELKIIKEGHVLWVAGTVSSVEISGINLKDCRLKIS